MYRVVHGWPLLAGIPVPLFLVIMLAGILGVFGGSMFGGLTVVAFVVLGTALFWGGLTWLFRQDQVAVPLFFVRRRALLGTVISSYNPTWAGVDLQEEP
jgi:hypothetical protein